VKQAARRFVVGSHRLGSTARPGAFLPSQIAAKPGVSVTLMYSVVSKPMKSRHVRDLAQEAEASGVRIVKSGKIPLHGKFLTWNDNDLVITSVNWASASSDPDFPEGEVGVHIQAADIATQCLGKLSVAHPSLLDERRADEPL
jgi:cardiolipin synthase